MPGVSQIPCAWEGDEEAMMSAALEPQREILENKQITHTAYDHIAHAHIGSQVAQGCSTDGTPHAHTVAMTTYHPHCDASPGPHARRHGAP